MKQIISVLNNIRFLTILLYQKQYEQKYIKITNKEIKNRMKTLKNIMV